MLNKNTTHRIVWTALTVLFTLFIFINSMLPASQSAVGSGNVLAFLQRFIGENSGVTEHLVRKTAHFVEYLVLGMLLILTVRSYVDRIFEHIFIPLFAGLAIPVVDEFIQLFVEGRSGQVDDVMLDFVGVLTGMAVVLLVVYIKNRFFKRRWWR